MTTPFCSLSMPGRSRGVRFIRAWALLPVVTCRRIGTWIDVAFCRLVAAVFAAAYVAGCLSLEDAARVICARSRIVKRAKGHGAMAVVELSLGEARREIAGKEEKLSIAVSGSPTSTVLSGDVAALARRAADVAGVAGVAGFADCRGAARRRNVRGMYRKFSQKLRRAPLPILRGP